MLPDTRPHYYLYTLIMSYRRTRHSTSHTFKCKGQLCKIFLEPVFEYQPGFWMWNVGFAIGKSNRQLNDWYKRKRNKRYRSLNNKLTGTTTGAAILKAGKKVFEMRWLIPPGDAIQLDCTSAEPDKQFVAWQRWLKHFNHPDWKVDVHQKMFYWFRPPYPSDQIWKDKRIYIRPAHIRNLQTNSAGLNYFQSFNVLPKQGSQRWRTKYWQ